MSCTGYREKLSGFLLSGESELNAELAQHVRGCAACREFCEAQKRLLDAMDSGVRAMVKDELPAALLPGVRARMKDMRIGGPWPVWLVPAIGVVLIALLIPVVRRSFSPRPGGMPVATTEAGASVIREKSLMLVTRAKATSRNARHESGVPEVIVLPAERAALTKMASVAPRMAEEPVAGGNASDEVAEELEVTPLKIEEIVIPSIGVENDK